MDKPKLLVSFSGGRTSGMMMKWCYDNLQDQFDLITVFANTGKEHESTLKFVRDCSLQFGIEIVWIESRHVDDNGIPYSKKGWKVSHRVVSYESASRNGEPFEEMMSQLGIPGPGAPFCSDQLKRKPIEHFMKSIGWEDYYKAIGIRIDEVDRCNHRFRELKIIYPLISLHQVNKVDVNNWWKKQSFNLDIPSGFGNCDNCWKKNLNILVENARVDPDSFTWWKDMVDKYKDVRKDDDLFLYRSGMSVDDILELSKKQVEPIQSDLFESFYNSGCGGSCEVF